MNALTSEFDSELDLSQLTIVDSDYFTEQENVPSRPYDHDWEIFEDQIEDNEISLICKKEQEAVSWGIAKKAKLRVLGFEIYEYEHWLNNWYMIKKINIDLEGCWTIIASERFYECNDKIFTDFKKCYKYAIKKMAHWEKKQALKDANIRGLCINPIGRYIDITELLPESALYRHNLAEV